MKGAVSNDVDVDAIGKKPDKGALSAKDQLRQLVVDERQRPFNRVCLALLILGAAVTVAGTFTPWVHMSTSTPGYIANSTRNAWQLGSDRSVELAGGPTVLIVTLLTVNGYFWSVRNSVYKRVVHRTLGATSILTTLLIDALLAFVVTNSWPGGWQTSLSTIITRGYGGVVSLVGVGVVMMASIVQLFDAEKRARSAHP